MLNLRRQSVEIHGRADIGRRHTHLGSPSRQPRLAAAHGLIAPSLQLGFERKVSDLRGYTLLARSSDPEQPQRRVEPANPMQGVVKPGVSLRGDKHAPVGTLMEVLND